MVEFQPAPWRYKLAHDRETTTLLWITRGQGRVIVEGVLRGITMHHALWLPAGTLFSIDLQPGAQALFVHAPPGLAPSEPQKPVTLHIRDSFAQAELTSEIDAMHREILQKRALVQEALEARVRLMGIWLSRQIQAGAAEAPKDSAAQRLVRRFATAVTRDYRSARIMAAYAEALDVTPTHLSRSCRQCCGKTAADLLTERKLHAARIALESPRPAVQEVARGLGFSSPAYFTRFMQAHTGCSPSALRAQARRAPVRA
ncbi:helix-turn-helix transcriptional regulator [Sagittula sp. M10.9X]|uniref:Helix-turn-helix transcriptional regulator n=2 Tax=Sagittula salina TaxID=2820268 RepID=A0A940MS46_9RHOB|nr:helix-turn-helix transcriptional regulator [Sagittula salina]